jgi:hypothetical protein
MPARIDFELFITLSIVLGAAAENHPRLDQYASSLDGLRAAKRRRRLQ